LTEDLRIIDIFIRMTSSRQLWTEFGWDYL